MNHRLRDTICKLSLKGLVAGRWAEVSCLRGKNTHLGRGQRRGQTCTEGETWAQTGVWRIQHHQPSGTCELKNRVRFTTPSRTPGLMES